MNHQHHNHNIHQPNEPGSNPCTDKLSDIDYLVHMIPHHQVAIDMCELMKPISKHAKLQNIYRTMIFNQSMEILFMKNLLKSLPKISGFNKIIYSEKRFYIIFFLKFILIHAINFAKI